MNMATVKISKTIPLPKALRKAWEGSNVLISADTQRITIQKINPASKNIRARLLKVGKSISRKDLDDAIRAARASR